MSRTVAVVWHASFSIAAGVLYFFFVLPRWWELSGDTSHTLGTALRIVTGALIGLAALPVVFTLLRTRRPEFGTPQMALRLRTASIALHVLAGVLIVGTAISEIWLSLDDAGPWLFGIYGAAAAIALLGIFAFYLAFVAELPAPPPKPLKPKKPKKGRRGRKATEAEAMEAEATEPADEAVEDEVSSDEAPSDDAPEADDETATVIAERTEVTDAAEPESTAEEPESTVEDEAEAESTNGGLRNRRRRRSRVRG